MTDIPAVSPVTIRLRWWRPGIPNFGIGAALVAMAARLADAFSLAYVDPHARRRPDQSVPDDARDGRDPDW